MDNGGVAREAYLIGRGETHAARVSSALRRREMSDPVKRAEILARLAKARLSESYKAKRAKIRRVRGRWVKSVWKRGPKGKKRYSKASKARWADPIFKARGLLFLKIARRKRQLKPKETKI